MVDFIITGNRDAGAKGLDVGVRSHPFPKMRRKDGATCNLDQRRCDGRGRISMDIDK
jgi:hypothetical protein